MPVLTFTELDPLLWLAFVNSRYLEVDPLGTYQGLISWSSDQRLIDRTSSRLLENWIGSLDAGETVNQAQALRKGLSRAAGRMIADRPVDAASVAALNQTLAGILAVTRFRARQHRLEETVVFEPFPAALLYPIALSAGRALADPERFLLKTCANRDCGMVFADETRNHSRRWCAMSVCGNQAKARAYYWRKKAHSGS